MKCCIIRNHYIFCRRNLRHPFHYITCRKRNILFCQHFIRKSRCQSDRCLFLCHLVHDRIRCSGTEMTIYFLTSFQMNNIAIDRSTFHIAVFALVITQDISLAIGYFKNVCRFYNVAGGIFINIGIAYKSIYNISIDRSKHNDTLIIR